LRVIIKLLVHNNDYPGGILKKAFEHASISIRLLIAVIIFGYAAYFYINDITTDFKFWKLIDIVIIIFIAYGLLKLKYWIFIIFLINYLAIVNIFHFAIDRSDYESLLISLFLLIPSLLLLKDAIFDMTREKVVDIACILIFSFFISAHKYIQHIIDYNKIFR